MNRHVLGVQLVEQALQIVHQDMGSGTEYRGISGILVPRLAAVLLEQLGEDVGQGLIGVRHGLVPHAVEDIKSGTSFTGASLELRPWRRKASTPEGPEHKTQAVQVAGINVYPGRVRDMLLEHPKVKECAVRLMRPEEGPRLKALVVPEQGQDSAGLETELRAWAREKLTQYERPGSWAFSRRLPVNSMGKLSDW